jgi:uncharacterized protein DUF3618
MSKGTMTAEPPPTSRATPAPGARSAEQIRADIVVRREQLGRNVDSLRGRVNEITDVRAQVRRHRGELILGGAVIGGLAAAAVALRRRGDDY